MAPHTIYASPSQSQLLSDPKLFGFLSPFFTIQYSSSLQSFKGIPAPNVLSSPSQARLGQFQILILV